VAEPGVAEDRLGVIFETWAHELQSQPVPINPADAAAQQKNLHRLFAEAGTAFKEVADVNPLAVEPLWRSGNCFFFSQAYKEAGEVLLRFLRSGKAGEREAEAWFALAEAYQAQNLIDLSRGAYLKCMEFEGSPFGAKACYQLAVQAIARSRLDEAEEILTQHINRAAATGAEREVRRKSLFTLGDLLYQRRQYDKAEYHLAVALSEFPTHPEALTLKDRLGESRMRIARRLAEQERDATPASRAFFRKERLEKLEKAGKVYESLMDELRAREVSLSESESLLLRKARFAVADCYIEREHYLEALYRCAECAQNYAGTKEGLVGYEKMMRCYESPRLGHTEKTEAAPLVSAAVRVTVLRIQDIPDAVFPYPSVNYTKRYWQDHLSQDSRTLQLPPPPWQQR
jgi:tetratricopeptide (TPR) repeat protein